LLRRRELDRIKAFDVAFPATLWAADGFTVTNFGEAVIAENVLAR